MAKVYGAPDFRLGCVAAVKTLRGDLAGDQLFQARFRRGRGRTHPAMTVSGPRDKARAVAVPRWPRAAVGAAADLAGLA
jgi:hypothetical protein